MNQSRINGSAVWMLLALGLGLLNGCGSGDSTSTQISGQKARDAGVRIKKGDSQETVATLLGEPTDKASLPSGTEIWKWQYTEQIESSSSSAAVPRSHSSTLFNGMTFVEFKDGVVTQIGHSGTTTTTATGQTK